MSDGINNLVHSEKEIIHWGAEQHQMVWKTTEKKQKKT